jgi:hypothetical protein
MSDEPITGTGMTADEVNALYEEIREEALKELRDGEFSERKFSDGFGGVIHSNIIAEVASTIAEVTTKGQAEYHMLGAPKGDDAWIATPEHEQVLRAARCDYVFEEEKAHGILAEGLALGWRQTVESELRRAAERAFEAYKEST